MREDRQLPIIDQIAGAPDALTAFGRIAGEPYSFFLDSAADHEKLGKFSFLGYEPFLVFTSKADNIRLAWADGLVEERRGDPFSVLKELMARYRKAQTHAHLPLTSGAVGYFSYDLKDFVEELPSGAVDDIKLADSIIGFYDVVVIYDHDRNKACVSSSGVSRTDTEGDTKLAQKRLEQCKAKILNESAGARQSPKHSDLSVRSNFSRASYIKAILKAKEYIRKGDIYQVNLSQRFEADLPCEPFELYKRLRALSPAPFAAYLNFGDCVIASSSPERFLLKRGDHVETRPIKGTRPRGDDLFSDAVLEAELIGSAKDRAEHVMIVDLERNDLGRICEYGSVHPTEFVILEKYSTVFHLVSTVAGTVKKGLDQVDCLKATFPGGSITGAPKIRSMQIIEELEPVKRSIYTGAIGYLSFDGNMDTSIVIRTLIIKDKKVYFQVGGGIVADSDPQAEYDETLDKAKALMQSLGVDTQKSKARTLCRT